MAQKKITDLTLRSSFDETVNMPGDDTSQTWRVTGQQLLDFITSKKTLSNQIENLTLATSVSGNALTIAAKTKAGANASSTDPISVSMRSSTLTSGVYNLRQITGALSVVVSSGSTLGQVDGQPSLIYVYLIDNAGTLELAVSHAFFPEDSLVSTTAEGGAGAADSASVMYSTTARSNVPTRLVGTILNTQTTAGTWASAGTQVQLTPSQNSKVATIQKFTSGSGTYYTPAGCKWIRVRLVGAGGGGAGGGTSGTGGSGGNGGDTTFGTSLLTGSGGSFGSNSGGGDGGGASLGTGPIGTVLNGGKAGSYGFAISGAYSTGGTGGSSFFGGQGGNSGSNGVGVAGKANTGGGGGGGSSAVGNYSGGGGAGGGFVDAIIGTSSSNPLLASYPYAVGAAGTAGAAGTGGNIGGAGGSGYIEVTEFYQ